MSAKQFAATIVTQLFVIALLGALCALQLRKPQYDYKVLAVAGDGYDRTKTGSQNAATVDIDEQALTKLGGEGWEVVSSYLEMETAYPNFGDEKYVTGMQPNIRPQRAVLILRRAR